MTTSVVATTATFGAITALGVAVVAFRLALRRWTRRTVVAIDRPDGVVVTADASTRRPRRYRPSIANRRPNRRRASRRDGDDVV